MERSLLDEAERKLRTADHMLTMTYPMVKDPKLLIAILQNTLQGMDLCVQHALKTNIEKKNIPSYNNTFEGRFAAYQKFLAKKHKTPKNFLIELHVMKETLEEHKKSPVEFRRKDSFVICDKGYKTTQLTKKLVGEYIQTGKQFVQHIKAIDND